MKLISNRDVVIEQMVESLAVKRVNQLDTGTWVINLLVPINSRIRYLDEFIIETEEYRYRDCKLGLMVAEGSEMSVIVYSNRRDRI